MDCVMVGVLRVGLGLLLVVSYLFCWWCMVDNCQLRAFLFSRPCVLFVFCGVVVVVLCSGLGIVIHV